MKKTQRWLSITLIIAGISGMTLIGAQMGWYSLPDWLIRIMGILCLAALPVMAFTSVKLLSNQKKTEE